MSTANKNMKRIFDRIAAAYPCTTVGMLAGDLRLAESTVRKHLARLVDASKIELVPAEPGYSPNYQVTVEARRDLAIGCDALAGVQ